MAQSWSSLVNKEVLQEIPPHERKRQEVRWLFLLVSRRAETVDLGYI